MKILFFILLSLSSLAHAQITPKLTLNIANKMDALLWDTVNEGEGQALVSRPNGIPQMTCEQGYIREAGKGLAKCTITFDVKENSEEEVSCQMSCFLITVFDLKTSNVLKNIATLEDVCLETLSESCF